MTEYKCLYCPKTYKQKHNYNRHVSICKFLKSSEKEQQYDLELHSEKTPTLFELFQIVFDIYSKKTNELHYKIVLILIYFPHFLI